MDLVGESAPCWLDLVLAAGRAGSLPTSISLLDFSKEACGAAKLGSSVFSAFRPRDVLKEGRVVPPPSLQWTQAVFGEQTSLLTQLSAGLSLLESNPLSLSHFLLKATMCQVNIYQHKDPPLQL